MPNECALLLLWFVDKTDTVCGGWPLWIRCSCGCYTKGGQRLRRNQKYLEQIYSFSFNQTWPIRVYLTLNFQRWKLWCAFERDIIHSPLRRQSFDEYSTFGSLVLVPFAGTANGIGEWRRPRLHNMMRRGNGPLMSAVRVRVRALCRTAAGVVDVAVAAAAVQHTEPRWRNKLLEIKIFT